MVYGRHYDGRQICACKRWRHGTGTHIKYRIAICIRLRSPKHRSSDPSFYYAKIRQSDKWLLNNKFIQGKGLHKLMRRLSLSTFVKMCGGRVTRHPQTSKSLRMRKCRNLPYSRGFNKCQHTAPCGVPNSLDDRLNPHHHLRITRTSGTTSTDGKRPPSMVDWGNSELFFPFFFFCR